MIRPLTIATCLLACGSGLYLYQSKHEVEMLDRTIEKTVHDTNALREQSRLLAAEWTMLNDPQRLQQFASAYLILKPIAPSQFTSLADLDSRLPAPSPAAPPQGTGEQELVPVTAETTPSVVPEAASTPVAAVVADEDMPVPPIPGVSPALVVASVARPADTRIPDRMQVARPMVADSQAHSVAVADARAYDQRPSEQRPPEQRQAEQRQAGQRVAEARVDTRTQGAPPPRPIGLAAPRTLPVYAPVNMPPRQYRAPMVAGSAPYGGSLLGMARGSMPPAPRPTPMNTAYDAN
jgi:hypothetical protein